MRRYPVFLRISHGVKRWLPSDSAAFRRNFLDEIRISKGLGPLESSERSDIGTERLAAFDRIADALEQCIDLSRIAALAGISL